MQPDAGSGLIGTGRLEGDRAGRWARAALDNVTRTYPNAPQLWLRGPEDLRPPEELHPAFHGALDWHSAVHMHWSLVRLLRLEPELDLAHEALDAIGRHLSAEALDAEAAHLRANPTFERPYGWGWGLALATEVARWDRAPGVIDGPALGRFADTIVELLMAHLPRSAYPVRVGTHGNTAFAMILALEHARRAGRDDLEQRLVGTARRWYLHDRVAPTAYEPSGEDFLSPTLTEAHLMGEVLSTGDFSDWFETFLPGTAEVIAPSLADPPTVVDDADGRLVHLRGLTLSRAWNWRSVARSLPPRDERRVAALDAADRHLADGLDHVLTGDYLGDHWLVSFALLALTGL